MPKIFHLLLSLDMGGLERGAVNLIRNSSARYVHVVCCLRGKGPLADELPPGVTVHALNVPGGNRLSTLRMIRTLIHEEGADLLRCYNQESLFHAVPVSWSLGVPVIYYNGGRSFPEKRRKILLERILSNFVKIVVVPSDDLGSHMNEIVGIPRKKSRTIENGIDFSRFAGRHDSIGKRLELGLESGCPVLGTVGRLDPQKNHRMLFEAFSIIEKRFPMARLLVVGDGHLRFSLEEYVKRLNIREKVLFLGSSERRCGTLSCHGPVPPDLE